MVRVLAGSCFCHRGHNSASGAASAELPTRQHASATANASIHELRLECAFPEV